MEVIFAIINFIPIHNSFVIKVNKVAHSFIFILQTKPGNYWVVKDVVGGFKHKLFKPPSTLEEIYNKFRKTTFNWSDIDQSSHFAKVFSEVSLIEKRELDKQKHII